MSVFVGVAAVLWVAEEPRAGDAGVREREHRIVER
jgi:hypothetical protein